MDMPTRKQVRNIARGLRQEGCSVKEIAEELGVSKSTVSGWVRDIMLTQAQVDRLKNKQKQYGAQNKGAQVNRKRAFNKRKLYQEEGRKRALNESTTLHLAGCMLYWAEGSNELDEM